MTEQTDPPTDVGSTAGLGPMPKHDHAFSDPEGDEPDILVWNAESMRTYAAQERDAERERWIEAVEGNLAGSGYGLSPRIAALIVERVGGPNVGIERPGTGPLE